MRFGFVTLPPHTAFFAAADGSHFRTDAGNAYGDRVRLWTRGRMGDDGRLEGEYREYIRITPSRQLDVRGMLAAGAVIDPDERERWNALLDAMRGAGQWAEGKNDGR